MSEETSGHGVGRWLLLLIVASVLAITLSEALRDRVLDALFGAEEEFDYSPTATVVNGSATSASPSEAPKA